MMHTDLLVVGGGINGVGVAVDAVGRGLSVILCEKDDLASHTSSASSKLIHGGLRYLEQIEFALVHEALKEREILLRKAPHLVHPLAFILPHDKHLRPAWFIRVGLFIYDYLSKRKSLQGSKKINFQKSPLGKPLKKRFTIGFSYSDCQTDDARLVVVNALEAKRRGATVLTQTHCQSVQRENGYWIADAVNQKTREKITIKAKTLVNATGPWVSHFLQHVAKISTASQVRLIKGSHVIVPAMYSGHHAYILQNKDKRVVFAIPYQRRFTLIGTTDVPCEEKFALSDSIAISQEEITYLLSSINYYFSTQLTEKDIVWSYAGVRSLYDDQSEKASQVTREYHLDFNGNAEEPPIISIFGGKITTYRSLAEHVIDKLNPYFSHLGRAWTKDSCLPGGDFSTDSFNEFFSKLKKQYSFIPDETLFRYANSYGTITHQVLKGVAKQEELGRCFGADLYEAEVNYFLENE